MGHCKSSVADANNLKKQILLDKPISVFPHTQQDEVNSAVHFCVNSHKSLMGERRG